MIDRQIAPEALMILNGRSRRMTNVQQVIKKSRRRLTAAAAIRRSGTAVAISAAAGLVLLAVDRLANLNVALPVYVVVVGMGLATGIGHALLTRPKRLAVAVRLDRQLGLCDRLGSAEAIRAGQVQDEGFAGLVEQDAHRASQGLDIKRATPIHLTQNWFVAGGLVGVLGLGFAFVPSLTKKTNAGEQTAEAQREAQLQSLDISQTIQEAVAQIDDEELDEQTRQELASLERLAEQLGSEGASSDEVAEARDRSAGQLAELADRIAEQSQRNLRAADAVAERFAGMEPVDAPMSAEEFAEALRNGEFGEAADLLDELMADEQGLSEEQRGEVADHLREVSEQLTEPSDRPTFEQLENAREALRDLGMNEQDVDELLDDEMPQDELQRALEDREIDQDVAQELAEDIERAKRQQRIDEQADDEAQALAEAMQDAADELDGGDTQSQADQTSEQDQRQTEQRSDERSSEQSNTEQRQGEQRLDESQQQAATEERRNREQREVPRNIPDGEQQQREAQEQLAPQPDGQPKGSKEMPRSLQQMLRRLAEAGREAEKGKADSERLREAARKLADTMSEQEKQRLAQRWMRDFGSKRDLGSKPGIDRGQRAQTEPPEEPVFTITETVDIGGDEEARNIIARWLGDEAIEGDPRRTTQGGEVIRRAQWAAEQAVDQSAVPRRYHEVIRRYFGQLDKTVDKAATSNKSAPPNPTAKPTAKPDGS